ncbi:MAG: TIGR03545 family protein, partial [bacterium]
AIEKTGESIIGAKVEIDNLNFSLVSLAISLDRLQVTNPSDTWKNLFETGRLSFDMELTPLARKKIIINDLTAADIRIGTRRKTDGKIAKKKSHTPGWFDQARESFMKQIASVPILNLGTLKKKINVDSLLALIDLQSVNKIEQVKQEADSSYQKWNRIISDFVPKMELEKIEKQVNEIKSQRIEDLDDLVSTFDEANKLYEILDELKKDIELKKKTATQDFNKFTSVLNQVDNWIEDDFNAIKGKARLGDFTPQNVGNMLFGEALVLPTIGLLKYISMARKYMPVVHRFAASGKVEKPPRFQGQNIRFPLTHEHPEFLIEHILISGSTNQQDTSKVLFVSGEVNGITSHPRLYSQPLTFALKGQLPQSSAYEVNGMLDHTKDTPEEHIEIKAAGIAIGSVALPEHPYLPSRIDADRGDISADLNFIGNQLDFGLSFTARPVNFHFAQDSTSYDAISKVTRRVFNSINMLHISANISGPIGDPGLKIRSNVDDILAQRISEVIGESARLARSEIRKKLVAMVEPKKNEALATINSHKLKITSEVDKIENILNDKLVILDHKKNEVREKIEKEKKKGLEEVTKKLKDIFKK